MLPVPKLDDQDYYEILDLAINTVVSHYPAWTDFNDHDPGITMLELFATVKESEQYFIDRISRENRVKYLKLMGIRRRPKQPAKTLVRMKVNEECELMKGHKLDAGGVCFETVTGSYMTTYDVAMCMAMRGDELLDQVTTGQMEFGGQAHFYMFGAKPDKGDACYISFGEQPPFGDPLHFYIRVSEDYPVTRNPLGDFDFASPVGLRWEYYTAQGWTEMEIMSDETCGLLFDGFVTARYEDPIAETTIAGQKAYYIRIVLEEGGYEAPPILEGISINICEAIQKDTLVEYRIFPTDSNTVYMDTELSALGRSEVYLERNGLWYPAEQYEKGMLEVTARVYCTIEDPEFENSDRILVINRDLSFLHRSRIGIGNGFPGQRIELEDAEVMEEPFAVLIGEAEEEDAYRLWERVEDFEGSGPEDRHFVIDSERGELIFGDCIHGMAPEGEILTAAYVRTKGSGGNIRAGKIDRFVTDTATPVMLTNITEGINGMDEETLDESFLRAAQSIRRPDCAVTAADYERYVKNTPGLMIESCKVLDIEELLRSEKQIDDNTVYMVIEPYGYEPGSSINACYEANIRAWMEKFRMVGTSVKFFFPEYIEVEVYAELVVKPQYRNIENRVRETVEEYFERFHGQFGHPVILSRLFGYMDRQEYVFGIRALSMDARGHGTRRTREGDILLPPQGTVVLKSVKTFLTIG